ncbi:MAG: dihydropteroate synthase [Thermodesulfobacteriota bacterium]
MLVIGEKVNGTRKSIAEAINNRDREFIVSVVRAQELAGADVIDVNAATGKSERAQEISDMEWLAALVQENTAKPLAIDSDNPEVLAAGLKRADRTVPWINSISAEPERIRAVLPLAKQYGSPVIALCMDEKGIPEDREGRVHAAGIIFKAVTEAGIDPDRIYFDPLVKPVCTDITAGKMVLGLTRELKEKFPGTKTAIGLSNISFGLPMRGLVNNSFMTLCIGAGLDAAIIDPTNPSTMMAFRAADALLGNDRFCKNYIREFRKGQVGK